jgi:hypothetical protein
LVNISVAQKSLSKLYSKYIIDYVFEDVHTVETADVTRERLKR